MWNIHDVPFVWYEISDIKSVNPIWLRFIVIIEQQILRAFFQRHNKNIPDGVPILDHFLVIICNYVFH